MVKLLSWLPRILALLFNALLVVLSLDSFSGDTSFGQQILGFLVHLIPAFLVGAGLVLAWRYRVLGGLLFLVLGMVFTIYFGTYQSTSHFLLISLPLFISGLLFMASQWFVGEK